MIEEQNVEQPENLISAPTNCEKDISKVEVDETSEVKGSTGKFKSEGELLKAYQCLEAEFTKRSQKLKELERMLSEKNIEGERNVNNMQPSSKQNLNEDYLNKNWEFDVSNFLEKNPNAKNFASEICELVLNDKQVALSTCPLETAWEKIASKNFVDKQSIISDEDFIDNYILNNSNVINKIVTKYFKQNLIETSPVVISGESASEFSVAKKSKPKTFDDAKIEAEKLF